MDIYLNYKCVIIFILIKCVYCSDKQHTPDDDEEDINFDTVVRELESLVTEDDETAGDTVVSDNLMQHGLGQIISQPYIQPEQPDQDQSSPPTPQDGKYYLIEQQPGKDEKYNLVSITHLEYIPSTTESEDTEQPTQQEQLTVPTPIGYQPQPHEYYHGYGPAVTQTTLTQPQSQYEQQTTETTQQTTQHTELEPETIPVQVESDEDEGDDGEPEEEDGEDKKPPKEPPEPTGPVDGENIKPSESIKNINKLIFMKKCCNGHIVKMDRNDFKILSSNETLTKYSFKANLEQLICNGFIVFQHSPEDKYCKSLISFKYKYKFLFIFGEGYYLIQRYKRRWNVRSEDFSKTLYFYTQSYFGDDIILTPEYYCYNIFDEMIMRCWFKPNAYCTKIIYRNQLVWEKTDDVQGYPIGITISSGRNIRVYFNHYLNIFRRTSRGYKRIFTKKKIDKFQDQ
ncbi:Theileria-specific sub-telomeric protein, SVSP family [Theileria annulata]|uniref:Conserved Theileria-specific sub-telomeric protein, SVSP family n=1 Tax=Theileria annulata TaxID=5874 RepID=Q4UFX1_THEAN|nr:Theileria-specific sub-telomeric protein, SVSP family [Theileria annulata]CAI74018.1 conserved Theileria-specific sub-telomeric protein, SVSP family [Theileria annulata]|eukprot:XP_954698.1 conserved Theileria-specific sub-telomeric protein, SVSP family [Theileria annulata]